MKETAIYILRHPMTGETRYIGKTRTLFRQRLNGHMADARNINIRNHKVSWLRSLPSPPRIQVLLTVPLAAQDRMERFIIALYKSCNARLTNSTAGGEGAIGHSPSQETRNKLRIAHLGRVKSKETIEKLRQASTGVKFTSERLANMSAAKLGKRYSVAQQQSIASRKRAKTCCVRGHLYTSETVVLDKFGWRHCRICKNTSALASYHRRKH